MARYRLVLTVQVSMPASVAAARIRSLRDADVKDVSADIVRVVIERHGRDARCAARRAFDDISPLLADTNVRRPPVWTARELGLLGLRRRSGGRLSPGDDDDGLSGVREPGRPI